MPDTGVRNKGRQPALTDEDIVAKFGDEIRRVGVSRYRVQTITGAGHRQALRVIAALRRQAPAPTAPEPEVESATPVRYADGVPVVRVEPVYSNLPVLEGAERIPLKGTQILVLADGRQVFGCVSCDFHANAYGIVRSHRKIHSTRNLGRPKGDPTTMAKTAKVSNPTQVNVMGMTLGEITELASQIHNWEAVMERQKTQLESWKARALTAEQENRKFRNMFDRLGFVPRDEGD